LFERPQRGERAVLVHVGIGRPVTDDDQQEFHALAVSAGADVAGTLISARADPSPRFLIGTGKLEELRQLVEELDAELILVDHELRPLQEQNLKTL